MDFFDQQDRARRSSGRLVFLFVVAIIIMIGSLFLVAELALGYLGNRSRAFEETGGPGWTVHLGVLALVSFATLTVIGLGSLYKTMELRSGGEAVASMLGGRLIPFNTTDLLEKRLLNIVEEMAIASGVAVPPVYVMDKEKGINAFAAGHTPDDAVIGVNRGTLEYLSRDELQGVVAHEFSHILNGDMRLNLRLIGLLHGILVIGLIGYYLLRSTHYSSRSSNGKGNALPLIGIAMLIVGFGGLFFGRLIKAAVSRQREYLADASAVQFTRNPMGISGALKKIGGLAAGSKMETPEAEVASHMFFGQGVQSFLSLMSTHPPLAKRIRAIEPNFDGSYPATIPQQVLAQADRRSQVTEAKSRTGHATERFGRMILPDRIPLDPAVIIAAVGAPTSETVQWSGSLLDQLSPQLADAIHEPFSARAVVYAMLLDREPRIREAQLDVVAKLDGAVTREEVDRVAPLAAKTDPQFRLPMIEILQGTLRQLSPRQYETFKEVVRNLIHADQKFSPFEFVLRRLVIGHLDRTFERTPPPRVRYPAMRGVLPHVHVLLSALARIGHRDETEAAQAFQQSVAALEQNTSLTLLSGQECGPSVLDKALNHLVAASPVIKKRVLGAATVGIAADGQVTIGEAELLRAIADAMDCPVPPLVPGNLTK